jgi:hypothetical protein
MITLAESMALAVLKGDMAAAYALADQIINERIIDPVKQSIAIRDIREHPFADGHVVYGWPEFQAFAKRLGLMWDLSTRQITITLPAEGSVTISQDYAAHDVASS